MGTIRIKCPNCNEVLEVDSQSGRIRKHHPELKQKPGSDFLKERLKSINEEKAKREALVAEGREKERTKKDTHDKLFEKVKEQSKDGRPVERPLRDIDID